MACFSYPLRLFLLVSGFGLTIALVLYEGINEIYEALRVAGLGVLLIAVYHFVPMLIETIAWRKLFKPQQRPVFVLLYWSRWVGEAVDGFLPVAQIGGDLVRIRLLDIFRFSKIQSAATLVVDITLTIWTQLIFTIIGAFFLIALFSESSLIIGAILFVCTAIPIVIALVYLQNHGMFSMLIAWTQKLAGNLDMKGLADHANAIDLAISDIYKRRSDVAYCCLSLSTAWMLGSIEIWLALWLLGNPCDLLTALIIESLVQAVRSAAFMVPAALGVQESAFIAVGVAVGIPADIALALGLTRRFRELIVGIPALLSWKLSELLLISKIQPLDRLFHVFKCKIKNEPGRKAIFGNGQTILVKNEE